MKLDHKCIRNILLAVEQECGLNDSLTVKDVSLDNLCKNEYLNDYSKKEIFYTILKLKEADFLDCSYRYASDVLYFCYISNLTFNGHEYLDSIRNNKVFDAVMEKVNAIGGGATIEIIKALAIKQLKQIFDI